MSHPTNTIIAEAKQEAEEEQYPYPDGDCQSCGEPLNNGEGVYCRKCEISKHNF